MSPWIRLQKRQAWRWSAWGSWGVFLYWASSLPYFPCPTDAYRRRGQVRAVELASSLWDGSAWARRPFASCLRHTRDGVSVLAHYGNNFRVGGVRRPCFRFFPQPYRRRAYAHMRRHDVLPQRGHDSRHCGHDGPGPGKRGHRQRGSQVAVVCAYGPFHRPAVFGQGLYPVCQGRRRIIPSGS